MVDISDPAPNARVKRVNVAKGVVNEDFELNNAYSEGIVVLYFFPAAFTGVCTKSTCALQDDLADFNSLDAHLYAISVDGPFTLKAFAEQHNLTYDLLSDFNKEAIQAFDIAYDDFLGLHLVAKRSLFAIKEGKITYKWVTDNAGDYPPFSELKEHLKALKE